MLYRIDLHWIVALAVALSVALSLPAAALGQDGPPVYCIYLDYDRDNRSATERVFYSDVFRAGEYTPNVYRWGRQFRDFLRANYRLFDPYRDALCFTEDHPGESYSKLESDKRNARSRGNDVIVTRWAPDYLEEGIEEKPIRDFHVVVSRRTETLTVCIRDHECEDGDRVTVAVNGENWFYDEEITNDWICESTYVSAGRHSIELLAENGTGFKGECSFRDGNTGEIRVQGETIETQTWKHRSGAGSKANIIVTLR